MKKNNHIEDTRYPLSIKISIFLGLILIIILASSCSVTKQKQSLKSSLEEKIEINESKSTVEKVDSTHTLKDRTITTITGDSNYTRETVIEYDVSSWKLWGSGDSTLSTDTTSFDDSLILDGIYNRGTTKATDYFQPIKRITIKETGRKQVATTIAADIVDSTTTHRNNEQTSRKVASYTHFEKLSYTTKDVERNSYWFLLWLLLIPAGLRVWYNYKNKRPLIS